MHVSEIWGSMGIYPKSLELHGGGKRMRPHELSPLSDWGE